MRSHNDCAVDAIFKPRSVAVYGASRDEGKLGHTLLRNIPSGGFRGRVVPVNPAGGEILGVEAMPALDGPVDLALISVPAASADLAVADAARPRCHAAIVLASGFGETGQAGEALEARLAETARTAGMGLVGPDCMGVVSREPGGWLNGSYFRRLPEIPGGVSMVSRSGRARLAGVGSGHPSDRALHRGLRDGRRFVETAERCRKPIVALKAGKGRAGARVAASHTGSLAGRHGAVQAAFAPAGVVEAATSDEFFDSLQSRGAGRLVAGRSDAVLTIWGGPGVLASDAAERLAFCLLPPGEATARRIRELAPEFAAAGNLIALTPQCPPANFPAAIQSVFDDPADQGVTVVSCGLDIAEFGHGVVAAHRRSEKPVTAFVLDVPSIESQLEAAGIPILPSPESAVAACAPLVVPR